MITQIVPLSQCLPILEKLNFYQKAASIARAYKCAAILDPYQKLADTSSKDRNSLKLDKELITVIFICQEAYFVPLLNKNMRFSQPPSTKD